MDDTQDMWFVENPDPPTGRDTFTRIYVGMPWLAHGHNSMLFAWQQDVLASG